MGSRREEVVDQALALVVEEGISGLTMKKVADRMGFTEPAMYRHFRDKQEMVIALIRRIRGQFEAVVSRVDRELPPEDYFRELLCPLLAYVERVRGVTILFLSESAYSRHDEIRKELYGFYTMMTGHVAGYLREAMKRDVIREGLDPEAAAFVLVGVIQSLTIRYILSGREVGIREKCEDVLTVYLNGVMR